MNTDKISETLNLTDIGEIDIFDCDFTPLQKCDVPPWNKGREHMTKEKHPLWGKSHSEDTKEKMRKKAMGKKLSEETKKKMSDKRKKMWEENPIEGLTMKGRKHSEETKKKIAEKSKGFTDEMRQKAKEACMKKIKTPDGVFNSGKECADYYGLTTAAVSYRMRSSSPAFEEWIFIEE